MRRIVFTFAALVSTGASLLSDGIVLHCAYAADAAQAAVLPARDGIIRARPIFPNASLAVEPPPSMLASMGRGKELWQQVSDGVLRASQVTVSGTYRLSEQAVLQAAGLDSAPYVWTVSADSIRNRLLRLPWIDDVQVTFTPYPARIALRVSEAEPWMIAEYERHSWLVSRKGNLLQALDTLNNPDVILETTELPRLDGLQSQATLESYLSSANARFVYAVKTIRLLSAGGELPFAVERYTLLPNGSLRITPQGESTPQVLVAVRSHEEAEQTVGRLKSVLEDLRVRGQQPVRIDLRFRNQAVVE